MAKSRPDWPINAIRRFMAYVDESGRLLHLSMEGISRLQGLPAIVEALANFEEESSRTEEARKTRATLDRSKTIAEFAQKEVTKGFPLLHAHTLIGTWAAFEAAFEDTLVSFLMNEPDLLRQESFTKLRIPLADFELLDREERLRFLVTEFERSQNIGRKTGIERCEALLEPLGLSGQVPSEIRKDIREMHHIRNVLVHRASIADRRLTDSCPWLNLKPGQPLSVTHKDLSRYEASLSTYVTSLINRMIARFPVSVDDESSPKANHAASDGGN